MRNQLFSATVLPLLVTGACTLSSDTTDDSLLAGDCSGSQCGDDDGHDDDNGGGDDGDCGSTCGGDGDDTGTGVDVDLDLEANLELEVVGSGLYVGVFPLGCLDISGDFSAHAKAKATLDDDLWVIAHVDASASIDIGSGCSCSGLDINAIAAINVHASIDADINSCAKACDGHGSSCESTCNHAGNTIVATASVDANACASVSLGGDLDLEALVGVGLDLHLTAVVDVDGNVLVNL